MQQNLNGSNTFGTMKIFRDRVRAAYNNGGTIGIYFETFFNIKVCCVFSLESHI